MNEFTKEELQIIALDMNTYIRRTPMLRESPSHKALRDKVESMIDNYCQHEWENICCQCTLDKIYCHKCEKDAGDWI